MTTDEVHAELGLEPGTEVISYCHSGSRSAMATQVLHSLGYDARNYVGSWHEWSRHDDLPIESVAVGEERAADRAAVLLATRRASRRARRRSRRADAARSRSSRNHLQHLVAADLRMELHRPRAAADAEGLRHRAARELDRARRHLEPVAVRVERLEPLRQHAEHRVALRPRRSAPSRRSPRAARGRGCTDAPSACASVCAPRQIAEERRLLVRPSAGARRTPRAATDARAPRRRSGRRRTPSPRRSPTRRARPARGCPTRRARGPPRRSTSAKSSGLTSGPWVTASTRIRPSGRSPLRAACAAAARLRAPARRRSSGCCC